MKICNWNPQKQGSGLKYRPLLCINILFNFGSYSTLLIIPAREILCAVNMFSPCLRGFPWWPTDMLKWCEYECKWLPVLLYVLAVTQTVQDVPRISASESWDMLQPSITLHRAGWLERGWLGIVCMRFTPVVNRHCFFLELSLLTSKFPGKSSH